MRMMAEDFNSIEKPSRVDLDVLEEDLQSSIQGEFGILRDAKEIFIKEEEGFELVVDVESLDFNCIKSALEEVYEEYRFDNGETLKSMFMEENDSFSEVEVDELISRLGDDLESLKIEVANYNMYSETYKTA